MPYTPYRSRDLGFCPACGIKIADHPRELEYDPTLPGRKDSVTPMRSFIYEIKPWGYLEEIQISLINPILNIDASRPMRFTFKPYDDLATSHCKIYTQARNVK